MRIPDEVARVLHHASREMEKLPWPSQWRWLRRRFARGSLKYNFSNVLDSKRFKSRTELWQAVSDRIGPETPITLLEFGVFKGNSMRFWTQNFTNPDSRFHGFDTFTGLPTDWSATMPAGTFSTDGEVPDIADARLTFHKGYLQNTLPDLLETIRFNDKVLVHIDTDIYGPALFVLAAMWWHGPLEKHFVFDEFGVDENMALANFKEACEPDIEFHGHVWGDYYELPNQVFATMRRVPYQPE